MAGHSHWKQIKVKKRINDKKKSASFSKMLNAVSVAAKTEPNPDFNPRLRSAIEHAREFNVPYDNILQAIKKISENKNLEDLTLEAYGENGISLIIHVITDNKNRAIQEIKLILKECGGKLAEPGSVFWAFEQIRESNEWRPKFKQNLSQEAKEKIMKLIMALEENENVYKVYKSA